MRTGGKVLALLVTLLLLAAACSSDDGGGGEGADDGDATAADGDYEATIRRTAFGVPHIAADDLGSLGFGQRYAFAEDHLCTLADQVVKVRGERARWHGAGEEDANLNSDLAYRQLDLVGRAEQALPDLDPDARAVIQGYAAGYNAYLAETGVDELAGWCAGEEWVEPITELDLVTYYKDLGLLASGRNFLDFAATAQPPGGAGDGGATTTTEAALALPTTEAATIGSNGWAIGADRSETGGGMLLANPHFPWSGELRLWESHLTVPGEIDIYGASLLGTPGVLIGFNDAVAWTHTVSAGNRFTAYTLDLVPGDPTSYVYGDEERAMTSTDVTVEVLGDDGEVTEETRTLWSSHYGPILDFPGVGWTDETTVTYRDANIDNDVLIEQFLAMDRAGSMEELQAAHRDITGIPWVNTMATSADGTAWYADTAATPNLSEEAIAGWLEAREDDPLTSLAWDNGAVLLDGGDPVNEWVDAEGARSPGLVPFADMPQLERRDFVFNANDSYWLSNPEEPLTGYSPMHGEAEVPQAPRTQQNALTLLGEPDAGVDELDLESFSLEEVQDALFANVSRTAVALKDEVVARCEGSPLTEACQTLADWDGRDDLDRPGAPLWREFMSQFAFDDVVDAGALWAEPFDPERPLETPSGLVAAPASGPDPIVAALSAAQSSLTDRGFAVDATLEELQFALPKPGRIPVPGGTFRDGTMNIIGVGSNSSSTEPTPQAGETASDTSSLSDEGYEIGFGSSFILTVEFGDDGPRAEAMLTYSQSGDPDSPQFSDQTEELFGQETWRPVLFTEDAIAADPDLDEYTVTGERDG
ncbi:MAG TPA: penicillin acylase family protein [Acidimicrobiales bacterium]|nr:penicillin acylase family protein [Acidimicrobiales bacterium]